MRSTLSVASVISLTLVACTQAPPSSTPVPVQATAATLAPASNDSLVKDRTQHANEVLASIVGKEELPAEQVYKNIQLFKGLPAGRLVAIMNRGFSNSLGVSCSHCHVIGEYDREDKPTKQIARDMSAMVTTINGTILKNIKNLKSPNPTVNCGTCHNGRPRPGAGSAATAAPRPGAP
jgi:hypothetical protein